MVLVLVKNGASMPPWNILRWLFGQPEILQISRPGVCSAIQFGGFLLLVDYSVFNNLKLHRIIVNQVHKKAFTTIVLVSTRYPGNENNMSISLLGSNRIQADVKYSSSCYVAGLVYSVWFMPCQGRERASTSYFSKGFFGYFNGSLESECC